MRMKVFGDRTPCATHAAPIAAIVFFALLGSTPSQGEAAAPKITEIRGESYWAAGITNGRVDMSIGTAYNGCLVVNDEAGKYAWTIVGTNFGTKVGQVVLNGRVVPLANWSNGSINIAPTGQLFNSARPWDWGPVCTALTIVTSNGTVSTAVNVVPAVKTRIYGQCTHWGAYRRLKLGLRPSPTAYDSSTVIDRNWVPQTGDQLQFPINGGNHTAIVEVVNVSKSPTTRIYNVRLSQVNAAGRNEYGEYTTTFTVAQVGNGAPTQVLAMPRFASWGTTASRYYR